MSGPPPPRPPAEPATSNTTSFDASPEAAGIATSVRAADRRWREAAEELGPAKSLARVDERAKQVVSSVGLVGTILTGLGLVAAAQLSNTPAAQVLAISAVAAAVTAVVVALVTLLVRLPRRRFPIGNLTAVQDWYEREFQRAYWVIGAGIVTVVAVVLAGITAVTVLATGSDHRPQLSVHTAGTDADMSVSVRVAFTDLDPGTQITTQVIGTAPGKPSVVLARDATVVGAAGAATIELSVPKAATYATIDVSTQAAGWRCTATVPTTVPTTGPDRAAIADCTHH